MNIKILNRAFMFRKEKTMKKTLWILAAALVMFVPSIFDNGEIIVKAATKTLGFSGQWMRGEDIDSTGYNEYKFTVLQSGLLKLNIIRYEQQYTDITDADYNHLISISNASCSRFNPSSAELEEYFDPGTYYIKIQTTDGCACEDLYDIKASFTPINCFEKEPNKAYTAANPVKINKLYTGIIAVGDEADWFKITVESGIYTLRMQTYGSIYYNLWDNDLVNDISHNVWESGGNNDMPGIINEDLTLKSGTYYLRVVSVNKSAKYVMSLSNKKVSIPQIKMIKNLKGKRMKVFLSRMLNDVSGYQIRYAIKKDMVNAKYTKKIDKYKTSKNIGGLKKKTYFVQVRAYVESNGYQTYSKWSKIKKIKIKR